jgi:hypothetical protein
VPLPLPLLLLSEESLEEEEVSMLVAALTADFPVEAISKAYNNSVTGKTVQQIMNQRKKSLPSQHVS